MMKRMVIVAAVMAVVASSAMAASLVNIPALGTNVATQGRAITPDGKYVTGVSSSTSGILTSEQGWIWDATNGTRAIGDPAKSNLSGGTGIGYRTNPTTNVKEIVVGGRESGGQYGVFLSTDNGANWGRKLVTSGTSPASGPTNSIGGGGTTGDCWFGWTDPAAAYNTVSKGTGDPITFVNGTKSYSTNGMGTANGLSNTGRMAGSRKSTSGLTQNYWFQNSGTTGLTENSFNGLDGTKVGMGQAMSGDGTKVFGYSHTTADQAAWYPYMYTISTTTTTALPLLPGTTTTTGAAGYVYGASTDGRYAVGMDYVGMEKAVLWDTQLGTVTDLTTYATNAGILGAFTGNLRRAYSVGVNGLGQPVITGYGYAPSIQTGYTGFVLTIPEPATLSFLALGGLAMLRRRH